MKRSTDRILTTHAGSLPRPADLLEMVRALADGRPYDREAYARRVKSAVGEIVRRQVELGVDVIDDGEMGKPSFVTYITDRLSGFELSDKATELPWSGSKEFVSFPEFYAATVVRELIAAARSLTILSERGRVVREHREPTIRQLLVRDYRLVYQVGYRPNCCSSRSCLALGTDVSVKADVHNVFEGSPPGRDAADQTDPNHLPCARYAVGGTSRAIAQINPVSSRATAVATFGLALPRATNRRKRVVNRSWAFQAMSRTIFGSASCR